MGPGPRFKPARRLQFSTAILRPFAHVIAWAATLAILCEPLQLKLVERTGRVAVSAFITSVVAVLACLVPLLLLGAIKRAVERST